MKVLTTITIFFGLVMLICYEALFKDDSTQYFIRWYFAVVLIISGFALWTDAEGEKYSIINVKKTISISWCKIISSVFILKNKIMKSNVETSISTAQKLWLELPTNKFCADDQKSYEFVNVKPEKHIITGDGVVVRYGKFYFMPSRVPCHKRNQPLKFKINFTEVPYTVEVESEESKQKRKQKEVLAYTALVLACVVVGKFLIQNL